MNDRERPPIRVSVAMATCEGERFLADQLESIARQSRPPDELVISDDASADRTVAIAERFGARVPFEVKVLRNRRRLGFIENFFRAIGECRGDALAFSDQDDVWLERKLERCAEVLERDDENLLVVHDSRAVGASLAPAAAISPRIRRRRVLAPGALPPYASFAGFCLVVRRQVLAEAGAERRPRQRPGSAPWSGQPMPHDLWALLVAGALGRVTMLPERLALHRRHGENVTGRDSRETPLERVRLAAAHRSPAGTYTAMAEMSRERVEYLEGLRPVARVRGGAATAGLERAIGSFRRHARAMERRAALYTGPGAGWRPARVARHALRGDYGRRARGGLGVASLVKDVSVGSWPR